MTETLVQWFVTHLGGKAAKELIIFIISMIPILELRGGILAAGTSWSASCSRTASWSAGRESDSTMYSWEYYTGSVYPASDPSDFCMAAQDAPFPSACRKAGKKSDEQK